MTKFRTDERDPVLIVVDDVITDLSIGVGRHVARRYRDGDADTFVLQDGEEGRLRLALPDLDLPASVISMTQAAQRYLSVALGEPVPRCPLHDHAVDLVASRGGYDWVCPDGQWHCALGDYAEQAWPHFTQSVLASILSLRLDRRGITEGVWSFGVTVDENGPLATFAVTDLTPELVAALTDAAAPVPIKVSERPRQPRHKVEPVADGAETESNSGVRLVLDANAVYPGDELGYRVVNGGSMPLMTGLSFALDQQDDGWWYSIDTELIVPAIGLGIGAGQQRAMSARIPARATPGIYRLRKDVRFDRAHSELSKADQSDLSVELTAEFRVTDQ